MVDEHTLRNWKPAFMTASRDALIALRRFGLGPRKGDLTRIGADPRGALLAETQRTDDLYITDAALVSSKEALTQVGAFQRAQTLIRRHGAPLLQGKREKPPHAVLLEQEMEARLARLDTLSTGLTERLVMFWTNHFAIALKNQALRAVAGSFEREAIRPHVYGRFGDMLKAVEQHPAMLMYLDNTRSVGPNSIAGGRNRRGVNENLAREVLELHTLGVDGGYNQADVTALACILSGWTVASTGDDAFHGGQFTFAPARHEPGPQVLLDRCYAGGGLEQGEAALAALAQHPATARHIALKFARHFVADTPPPALVQRLARAFADANGDLGVLTRTLITSDEAWRAQPEKMRSPQEFLFAAHRLVGRTRRSSPAIAQLGAMGQPMWNPGSPKGFADMGEDWISPRGLKVRLDVAAQIARGAGARKPLEVMETAFGPEVSIETARAVRQAETPAQAIALVLMAPEFQRR